MDPQALGPGYREQLYREREEQQELEWHKRLARERPLQLFRQIQQLG